MGFLPKKDMARLASAEQEKKKDYAKLLYVRENITNQDVLAEKTGVSKKTLGKWISEGNWKSLKKNLLITRQEQYNNLLEELEHLNDHIKTLPAKFADSKLGDTRRKLIKDIKDLEVEKIGVSEVISVIVRLLEFSRKDNHENAILVSQVCDKFIKSII